MDLESLTLTPLKASRLSDEDEEGEPLELDEPEADLFEDDDTGEFVDEDEEEEEDLPPTIRISEGEAEEEEEDKEEKGDDFFGPETPEEDLGFKEN